MQLIRSLPLLLALGATSAVAAPGGSFEFKLTSTKANGRIQVSVSGKNVRSDMRVKTPGMGELEITTLVKGDKIYLMNTKDETYSDIDSLTGPAGKEQKFTVKRVGTEKIGKWDTVHVIATNERGEATDVWTTKDIDIGRSIFEVLGQRAGSNAGMMAALEGADAAGFPVKMVSHERGDLTMELVSYESKTPASSKFEIPSSWKKTDAASVALPPEARRKMEEALKRMTPEQRRMMEAAMKGQAGQQ